MLKRILWLSISCFITLNVHAQHEEKVQTKLSQIQDLIVKVETSALSTDDREWATQALLESLVKLESYQEEKEIDKLKEVELQVNAVNQAVVKAMIQAQKIKLISKIKQVDALILEYSEKGMDTTRLQSLQASMLARLTMND